ncbi:MAG: hypothetical protein VWZ99_04865 [Aquiluna sp.]|jgi:hypothetical protein
MKAPTLQSILTAVDFHNAAVNASSLRLNKPALSNYIHAVIHAKDAICLEVNGKTGSSKRHAAAVDELRLTRKVTDHQLKQFESVLNAKTEIEYVSGPLRESRFRALAAQAERFLNFSYALLNHSPELIQDGDLG